MYAQTASLLYRAPTVRSEQSLPTPWPFFVSMFHSIKCFPYSYIYVLPYLFILFLLSLYAPFFCRLCRRQLLYRCPPRIAPLIVGDIVLDTVSYGTALTWTLLLPCLKSVYLNPKSNLRVEKVEIRFNPA